jgi:hypothetical protein
MYRQIRTAAQDLAESLVAVSFLCRFARYQGPCLHKHMHGTLEKAVDMR